MEQKIKIKKQTKIADNEDWDNYKKEELIEKVKSLSAHNIQLKNLLSKTTTTKNSKSKESKPFDFSKSTFQHVALQVMYLGWDYKGYVTQEDTIDTIEHHLFEALIKTKLIPDRATSNYHRCGRTDKGVSSFGQVISIDLRSNLDKNKDDNQVDEINYCKILNKVLPNDIQCVAWSYVDEKFSARFDCQSRTYKYYFPRGELNLEKMKEASKKLLGVHDFRNFCKMDVGNGVVEFIRNILDVEIVPIYKNESAYDMYTIAIKAKAFLWHQIRCIIGVLFLIGQGKEEPNVIDELFNVEKYSRKPEYAMASEVPLNLFNCEYENLQWKYDLEVVSQILEKLNATWTSHAIKESMIKAMIDTLQDVIDKDNGDVTRKCLSENLVLNKSKNYVPLLQRQTCESLEEKITKYTKRKRIEVITADEEKEERF